MRVSWVLLSFSRLQFVCETVAGAGLERTPPKELKSRGENSTLE